MSKFFLPDRVALTSKARQLQKPVANQAIINTVLSSHGTLKF